MIEFLIFFGFFSFLTYKRKSVYCFGWHTKILWRPVSSNSHKLMPASTNPPPISIWKVGNLSNFLNLLVNNQLWISHAFQVLKSIVRFCILCKQKAHTHSNKGTCGFMWPFTLHKDNADDVYVFQKVFVNVSLLIIDGNNNVESTRKFRIATSYTRIHEEFTSNNPKKKRKSITSSRNPFVRFTLQHTWHHHKYDPFTANGNLSEMHGAAISILQLWLDWCNESKSFISQKPYLPWNRLDKEHNF